MRDFRYRAIWGLSRTSPRDQARFMYHLPSYIPGRHRAYALHLLARIVHSQRWGIGRVPHRGWKLYFKGGWGTGTGLVDHQVALLTRNGVTFARTGMLEADLANKQILMHLYQARYQERDAKDPFNVHKIRDGINMVEGTLPISLEELYEKQKKRPYRSALSIEQLLDQLKSENNRERSASRTELNKRFSFPFACVAFAIIGVPLGVTSHRRETSAGFAMGLVVATTYFLFVIIGDTLRANPHAHPELLVWFPNVLFIVLGIVLFRRLARQ
jgi:lipopolysaccharide export LptBFGC system permease protein LptF